MRNNRRGAAAKRWKQYLRVCDVKKLRQGHDDIAQTFKNGPHRGKDVWSLVEDLQSVKQKAEREAAKEAERLAANEAVRKAAEEAERKAQNFPSDYGASQWCIAKHAMKIGRWVHGTKCQRLHIASADDHRTIKGPTTGEGQRRQQRRQQRAG